MTGSYTSVAGFVARGVVNRSAKSASLIRGKQICILAQGKYFSRKLLKMLGCMELAEGFEPPTL